ncbi:hypothetical protein [Candidatus Methylacidithermus pantelleriae]|uniref:Uncharacterized protein n=1 Tax=Candidatus Methylacidithermus pantelleriae TaxID=2744239 RepID=A0A8J2FP50_9BACT|nr:hypothetical protein [Candidatus Methylacidithermus pantelleriae]CAF0700309.1 hypothetical protein MPNT_350007 [Candidatus Methylacidithermus pantelleriae]
MAVNLTRLITKRLARWPVAWHTGGPVVGWPSTLSNANFSLSVTDLPGTTNYGAQYVQVAGTRQASAQSQDIIIPPGIFVLVLNPVVNAITGDDVILSWAVYGDGQFSGTQGTPAVSLVTIKEITVFSDGVNTKLTVNMAATPGSNPTYPLFAIPILV